MALSLHTVLEIGVDKFFAAFTFFIKNKLTRNEEFKLKLSSILQVILNYH